MSLPTIAYKDYTSVTHDSNNVMFTDFTLAYSGSQASDGATVDGNLSMISKWLIYSNSDELATWTASISNSATATAIEAATDGLGVLGQLYNSGPFESSIDPSFGGFAYTCLFMPGQLHCLYLNASSTSGEVAAGLEIFEPASSSDMTNVSTIGSLWDDSSATSGLGAGW